MRTKKPGEPRKNVRRVVASSRVVSAREAPGAQQMAAAVTTTTCQNT